VKSDAHEWVAPLVEEAERSMGREQSIVKPHVVPRLPPRGPYFDTAGDKLLTLFQTSLETGLTTKEAQARVQQYGTNALQPPPETSLWTMLWRQLSDFIVIILIVAAIVCFGIGDIKAGVALLCVVIINGAIGLSQEIKAENALKALSSLTVPKANLLRDGQQVELPAKELVPGDIVVLDEGMAIPADLRIMQVSQLQIIEGVLTGESKPVTKIIDAIKTSKRPPLGDLVNMAFMGTVVARGRGLGMVVNSGITTEVGKISAAITSAKVPPTPLQIKLEKLGKWLVAISLIACAIVVAIGLGRDYGEDIVRVGISLGVSVIPEGLVTVVTLCMGLGMQRMAARHAIVRKLPSVETLGSVTTICSDKTGTLTEGKMKTEEMWADGNVMLFSGLSTDPETGAFRLVYDAASSSSHQLAAPRQQPPREDEFKSLSASSSASSSVDASTEYKAASLPHPEQVLPPMMLWSLLIASVCNNAQMNKATEPNAKMPWEFLGDATEVALAVAAHRASMPKTFFDRYLTRVFELAFESERKRMSVLVQLSQEVVSAGSLLGVKLPEGCTHLLLSKGASEAILNNAKAFLHAGADKQVAETELTEAEGQRIDMQGQRLASQGMRVLAKAVRFLNSEEAQTIMNLVNASPDEYTALVSRAESQLVFVSLAGILDPPRAEVPRAIAQCHQAGIRVCMITGDHAATAISIAKSIGIYREGVDKAIGGDVLTTLSEEQLMGFQPFPVVFSRVSPENKLKIVRALQRRGEVAAMTGDGVNDAAAIRQADVGIAMGQAGTELTRQASDIILADDNFATIVLAVEEGRRIFDNIAKFILYMLSCSSSEVLVMIIAVAADLEVPFRPMMILYANIVVDVPPSLSLGVEPPEQNVMSRKPRDPKLGVFTPESAMVILLNGLIMCAICLVVYWFDLNHTSHSLDESRSLAFAALSFVQILHAFMCRSIKGSIFSSNPFSNAWLNFACLISCGFIIAGLHIPGYNDFFELTSLSGQSWGAVFICCVAHLVVMEIEKAGLRYLQAYLERKESASFNGELASSPMSDDDNALEMVETPKV